MDTSLDNVSLLKQIMTIQSVLASAHFDLQVFMQLVAEEVRKITPATGTVVELVEKKFMKYTAVTGTVADYLGLALPIENSISGLCIRSKHVLISPDTEIDPRVNLEACRKVSARSLVVAPLIYDGKPVGVLKILSKYPNAFNELHIKILEIMAGCIASGLKHQLLFREKEKAIKKLKKAQERLAHLAAHDFLTKLPNRKFFDAVLRHVMGKIKRQNGLIAVMFMDIDYFKSINDTLGHEAGDKLLVKFATFLKKNVRKYDFVVRLGGDEFIILLDDVHKEEDVIHIAEKIVRNLQQFSLQHNDTVIKISCSIGISFYRGEAISPESLIRQADEALYCAKEAGRNGFKVF